MSATVVKLPTAARRQVAQRCNKEARAAKQALRDAHGHRFPFMLPCEREVVHLADFMEAAPLSADRRILLALIRALDLDHDTRLKLALDVVGDQTAKNIVELAFADTTKALHVSSVLRRRGLL